VSELMTDLDWWAATRYPSLDEDWGPRVGRHAYSEDAVLTPIFHALTRSGWRSRQHEPAAPTAPTAPTAPRPPDAVDEFHRDPLSAPIPIQQPHPSTTGRRTEQPQGGRHHRRREAGRTRG
jgi:hypothetical protein